MIVIYEHTYDIVDIVDVIEDDKFDEYVEHYKNKLLQEERYQEILEVKHREEYGSYNVRVMYSYENNPIWIEGFSYVKFDNMNNYKDEQIS